MGKRFDGCYSVYAWIWNHAWGTLFLVGGIYIMFWQQSFWAGAGCIAVGIYFYWTKSWTKKTLAVIAGEDPEQSVGIPGDAAAGQPAARVATAPARPVVGPTAPGSVSRRKTVIKNVLVVASVAFLVLGARALSLDDESSGAYVVVYGGLALACFFVYARITVHRATEDALPALPWGEMIVAVLTAAFSPNARHVSYTTPEGAAAEATGAGVVSASTDSFAADANTPSPGVEHALAAADGAVKAATSGGKSLVGWFSSLTGNAKAGVVAGAIVLVFVAGFLVSNVMPRSSSDESDGRASVNIDNPGGTGGDYSPPTDTSSSSGELPTPSSDSAAGQDGASAADSAGQTAPAPQLSLEDLLSTAPADGYPVTRTVYWDSENSVSGESIAFTTDDPERQDKVFTIALDELTTCYVGDTSVSANDFIDQAGFGMFHTGTIVFTNYGLTEIRVVTQ